MTASGLTSGQAARVAAIARAFTAGQSLGQLKSGPGAAETAFTRGLTPTRRG